MSTPVLVRTLPTTRAIVFGSLLVFSLVGLGASAAFLSLITGNGGLPDTRTGFAVAIPVLTLVFISPMLIVDFFRRGAFTSMIIVEIPVLGLLFILWLVDAAWSSNFLSRIQSTCALTTITGSRGQVDSELNLLQSVCTDIKLTVAFGWLAWIPLLGYFLTLLTVSIIGAQKGASVWKSSVRDCDFGYGSSSRRSEDKMEVY
ncbi:hypothetical protein BC629DRAFT_986617 [Irpex lacteus]|nr:hypothetical protein BC629DRAFT_986617 [Irpex lacteus]